VPRSKRRCEGSFDETRPEAPHPVAGLRPAGSERDLRAHDEGIELTAHRRAGGRSRNAAPRCGRETLADLAVEVSNMKRILAFGYQLNPTA
jgi:hypothetical protein